MGQITVRDKKAGKGPREFIHFLPAGLLFGLVSKAYFSQLYLAN
jgi:hypothetical protein